MTRPRILSRTGASEGHAADDADGAVAPRRSKPVLVASILFFLTGIPFPLFAAYASLQVLETRQLPTILGLRAFGGGFIEALGPEATGALLLLFAFVSALDVLAGYLLWRSAKRGGTLAVALFPVSMLFWVGFVLPGPILIGPLRLLLVASDWKALR